ncbi:MAG: tryptophan 7-halogenase [Pseudomonadota bacterium]|nr:tryptophan 7-halogenase [Pseudomonadota bacterium]
MVSVDVLVLGGGPAGMAVALTLANHGALSVAVVERTPYEGDRIGETLSPGVVPLLHYLGVWGRFVADEHQTSFGTAAAWGSESVVMRDYLYTPFGPGWHLDRVRFDASLAAAAEAAGATVWRESTVSGLRRSPDAGWDAVLTRAGVDEPVHARFVVDATGKAAAIAKAQGARRRSYDRQVAVAGVLRFADGGSEDTFTLVEAVEDGWWYSTRLPNADRMVAFVTDSDVARSRGVASPAAWFAALRGTVHTRERGEGGALVGAVRVHPARSSRLDRVTGDRWIAVGDAAASVDPLSASGIPRALDAGIHAARGIEALLRRGDATLLEGYEGRIRAGFESFLDTRAQYCAIERRWPDSSFWQRRAPSADARGTRASGPG